MKKLTIIFFSVLFALTTSVFANPISGGVIGVKVGSGDLTGDAESYTAGSNTYGAESGSKDAEYGAIFAELNIMDTPFSVGLEYVPFDADISLDGAQSNVSANVGDYTTAYILAMHELANVSVYVKAGMSTADIGAISHEPNAQSTVNSQSDSLDGTMLGIGLQTQELPMGLFGRLEYTHTSFDAINVTTTSNGSTSVKKTADGSLETITVSLAKQF